MERQLLIRDVYAREILDPAGNLTIETEVLAGEDAVGRASAPSGVFPAGMIRQGRGKRAGPAGNDTARSSAPGTSIAGTNAAGTAASEKRRRI